MRFRTAGESHGKAVIAFIEGLPFGLSVSTSFVNSELSRRQMGFGRGARMSIEQDKAEILSGVISGKTIGSPVVILIRNRDWENWRDFFDVETFKSGKEVFLPRPGHADLSGCLKYNIKDARFILERASARETAARVAAGALFKLYLKEFGVDIASGVVRIGKVYLDKTLSFSDLKRSDSSPVRCPDEEISFKMIKEIEKAKSLGDTVGGIFEVRACGVPPGIGDHTQWCERLDALISYAMMSIQGIKAVSIGCGWDCFDKWGSNFHDEIFWDGGFYRKTNRAGGIEGGISNGEEIVVRCFMKPIPTLMRPLASVDMRTKKQDYACKERSDVCAVPSAAIVGEAMLAYVLARCFKRKFGGDSIEEAISNFERYRERLSSF